jgi:hypothetical protein
VFTVGYELNVLYSTVTVSCPKRAANKQEETRNITQKYCTINSCQQTNWNDSISER